MPRWFLAEENKILSSGAPDISRTVLKTILALLVVFPACANAQINWHMVDSLYQPLPANVHVYFTNDSIDGKPNIAYYVEAKLQDRRLHFVTDTSANRRLTPSQFFERNNGPLLVVNGSFFEFVHHRNLNLVINHGRLLAYNQQVVAGKGKDTFTYRHVFPSAIGISKRRKADVAWTFTDSSMKHPYAMQLSASPIKDSIRSYVRKQVVTNTNILSHQSPSAVLHKWKVETAIGGGPVLLQNGEIAIANNDELKFAGAAINDKHPRTAMGYTADGRLIIMVVQGRFKGKAEGASLPQLAGMLQQLGCIEALNLDGGGSSCMLINGRQTIEPSDKEGQRAVPAVFMIKQ